MGKSERKILISLKLTLIIGISYENKIWGTEKYLATVTKSFLLSIQVPITFFIVTVDNDLSETFSL